MKYNTSSITSKIIAPCGMNCGICMGYLREENKCHGCREMRNNKYCRKCVLRNCSILKKNNWKFCFSKCLNYPCQRLKNLDKRYRTKYDMSMIENLQFIEEQGIRQFVQKERKRWECNKCGGVINVHRKICSNCLNRS